MCPPNLVSCHQSASAIRRALLGRAVHDILWKRVRFATGRRPATVEIDALYAAKKKGRYPSTSDGLEAAAKYFPKNRVPTDAWGSEFQYFSPASNCDNPFELISYGKDGSQGGEDANADLSSCDEDVD